MLREEQIDLRRHRAKTESLHVHKVDGRTRIFGAYRINNPLTGGEYLVALRGFDVGDNVCSCPDYKANTLGTCKHIEAVLAQVRPQTPERLRKRKAVVTRPEVHLHYGEQLTLALHLPARHSDSLKALAKQFFDSKGRWVAEERFEEFIAAAANVPEHITVDSDVLEFIDRAKDLHELASTAASAQQASDRGETPSELRNLLKVELYPYQLQGAIFAAGSGRAILGDDMGLGKTLQALAVAELLVRWRGISKVLVVAPASVKYQWASEIKKFTDRSVQTIEGDRPDRLEQYRDEVFFRLVNYEQVTRDLAELNAAKPDLIILDEAQRIKNWESKTSRFVKKLISRYALVLSGTPLENKLEELYSIVQFVDDRRLGPAFQFLHDHRVLDKKGNLIGYRNLDTIRTKLAPIFLRRTRSEVLGQLPERVDSTIYVELSDAQRRLYEEQRTALGRLLSRPTLSDLDRKRILACLTNLRLICNATSLFDATVNSSPKLDEFAELIRDLLISNGNHKAVVFSQWEGMLRLAATVLDALGIEYSMLYGRLPAANRKDPIARFQDEPHCRVFLSTDAGATGLNLQVADTVIHMEVPWNPAVLEQRIARVHRLGQSRPVHVIRLITRNSIEERILQVLEQKRALFAGIFDGYSDDVSFSSPGHVAFLDTVRDALELSGPAIEIPAAPIDKLHRAGVDLLEALAELLGDDNKPVDPALAERGRRALTALNRALST